MEGEQTTVYTGVGIIPVIFVGVADNACGLDMSRDASFVVHGTHGFTGICRSINQRTQESRVKTTAYVLACIEH